jgi:hypothetical protein
MRLHLKKKKGKEKIRGGKGGQRETKKRGVSSSVLEAHKPPKADT